MSYESSTGREVTRPTHSQTFVANSASRSALVFLEQGQDAVERLSCQGCITRELCAAVAAPLIKRSVDGLMPKNDLATLAGHGIETSDDRYDLCPSNLVTTAVRREVASDFWVATDDPLNTEVPYVRIAEALRTATQTLVECLDKNIQV